jgi:hypothetical protein
MDEVLQTFSVRPSGHIGQEILDAGGRIIAWTTDEWVARVICRLLTETESGLSEGVPQANQSTKA